MPCVCDGRDHRTRGQLARAWVSVGGEGVRLGCSETGVAVNNRSTRIVASTPRHAEIVINWLRREWLADEYGEGFYNNRSIIRKAAREGEMVCLFHENVIVGFAVYSSNPPRGRIDIMEVRPRERGKGYGRTLASMLLQKLAGELVETVRLECCPRGSESFWRRMNFTDDPGDYSWSPNPHLLLNLKAAIPPAPAHDVATSAGAQSSGSRDR